jgi:hypothetical protein
MIPTFYLSFSDAAKFALVARNLVLGNGYVTDFSFWGYPLFGTGGIPVLVPYVMAFFMKIFGVNDFAVVAFSFFFHILLGVFVYLLGSKAFNKAVGLLSALAVLLNLNFIDYATSGASESLFAFEIVLATYLFVLRKKWATLLGFGFTVLMYFSKPQAFIFMAGMLFLWLLLRFSYKKAITYFLGLGVLSFLVDRFILYPLSYNHPATSILMRGVQSIFTYSSLSAVSDNLRGAPSSSLTILDVLKKTLYNLYNFYKALPQIANPYIWALFFIGVFSWGKDKIQNNLKLTVIFLTVVTFLVTAMTIPFYRYIHPVVPLIYIIGVGTLVWVVNQIFDKKPRPVVVISTILILIFAVGQTLGVIFLDSRFERNTHNTGKPPVYVQLSELLRDNTNGDQIIITNLDTWGSWYGERKTVWFPLEPKQLIDFDGKIPFDAIYLTSYLVDDENYYMGEGWRIIYNNPSDQTKWTCDGCAEIAKEFRLKQVYTINSSETYERQDASAVLLIKR